MRIGAGPRGAGPAPAAGTGFVQAEPRRPHRGAWLRGQCVAVHAAVSDRTGRVYGSAQEHAAGVGGAIGGNAGNFQGCPIVQVATDGSPYGGHAHQLAVSAHAQGKLGSRGRSVVAVGLGDVLEGFA